MSIVTAMVGRLSEMKWTGGVDALELTSEERASAHFAVKTDGGRHLRVSLPRGAELQDGDVLMLDGDTAVAVKAKEETLLLIRPGEDRIAWWAACYQLGNFHRPARFREDGILTLDDPLAAQMLGGLGIPFERVRAPFVGRRFGAAGAHHHHVEHGEPAHRRDGHTHHHHG